MENLKIAVLYEFAEDEADATPPPRKGGRKKRKDLKDREEVRDLLSKRGHEISMVPVDGTRGSLIAMARLETDVVFNLVESFGGDDTKDMNVAAFLDLIGLSYTGSGPQALYLAQDKALTKKVLQFHGLKSPAAACAYKGRLDFAHEIDFPLIVKPASEDGSIGIDVGAVVHSIKELMERVDYVHKEFDSPALIEEFVEGREIYLGVLGNDPPVALPPVELDLSQLPEGTPKIAGTEVKWNIETDLYKLTKPFVPDDLDEELTERLQNAALEAYRALKLRDYGRVDVRLTPKGEVYIIEVNPNPWIHSTAEFALAAKQVGVSHPDLVERIVELARRRAAGLRDS